MKLSKLPAVIRSLALLIPVVVWVAGCGGSSSSSTSAATTPTSASTASATTATSARTTTSQTQTNATTSSTTHTTQRQSSADVRLPVTFVIRPGGKLVPPQIGVPGALPVQLTVTSADGAAHHVVLQSPSPTALSVPAGGRASTRITGLKKGQHKITVDGKPAGELVIGVSPGP
jgi:hypothetical protein